MVQKIRRMYTCICSMNRRFLVCVCGCVVLVNYTSVSSLYILTCPCVFVCQTETESVCERDVLQSIIEIICNCPIVYTMHTHHGKIVCVCLCTRMYLYVYVKIYIFIYIIYEYMKYIYIYTHIYTYMNIYIYIYLYIRINIYIYICTYIYVHMYI